MLEKPLVVLQNRDMHFCYPGKTLLLPCVNWVPIIGVMSYIYLLKRRRKRKIKLASKAELVISSKALPWSCSMFLSMSWISLITPSSDLYNLYIRLLAVCLGSLTGSLHISVSPSKSSKDR
ncbi:hypothetical protein BKA67DRAFT_153713 [Truncatella angustata]|uniref:Uncharacterized protein n=1 Tax=Truncatella angustata TaxID=152316 RepID=A0A9P8UQF9_9PEZI|nr:uncharacterized protein BKA67DRAFT_153713 [Truncatella angustata]KAH6656363.1 hypothetical protein BKA67DRAFT_153713 [Truncatella angustata]